MPTIPNLTVSEGATARVQLFLHFGVDLLVSHLDRRIALRGLYQNELADAAIEDLTELAGVLDELS